MVQLIDVIEQRYMALFKPNCALNHSWDILLGGATFANTHKSNNLHDAPNSPNRDHFEGERRVILVAYDEVYKYLVEKGGHAHFTAGNQCVGRVQAVLDFVSTSSTGPTQS